MRRLSRAPFTPGKRVRVPNRPSPLAFEEGNNGNAKPPHCREEQTDAQELPSSCSSIAALRPLPAVGELARQTLQRRGNHNTFHLRSIAARGPSGVAQRFRVDEVPTLVVVEERAWSSG